MLRGMPKLKPNESHCSVARAIDLLGDRWMLLLIREVVFGTRRFDDFQSHMGIARNVLANRLSRLVEAGVLEQVPLEADGRRMAYRFTEMGEDLLPMLIGFMQWGDRWLQTPGTVPIRVIERATGKELPRVQVRNRQGTGLGLREIDWKPGPGASHPNVQPLVAAYEAQRRIEPRKTAAAPGKKSPA